MNYVCEGCIYNISGELKETHGEFTEFLCRECSNKDEFNYMFEGRNIIKCNGFKENE